MLTSLDRETIGNLSKLQKQFLAKGLRQHYRAIWRGGRRKTIAPGDHRHNAARCASLRRLAARGLFYHLRHGHWHLTPLGVQVAAELWPEITLESQKPSDGEMALILATRDGKDRQRMTRAEKRHAKRVLAAMNKKS